jgi:hypothetical protein
MKSIYNGVTKDLEIAGENILKIISKVIKVNTFCMIKVDHKESFFINVINHEAQLATKKAIVPVYESY